MKIDPREMLTVVGGTEAAASLPDLAEAVEDEEIVYTLDTLPKGCFWTWEEVAAAVAPHEAEILAAENREKHPARRPSRSRAGRSRFGRG